MRACGSSSAPAWPGGWRGCARSASSRADAPGSSAGRGSAGLRASDALDVDGLRALVARLGVVLHARPLGQRAKAVRHDRRVVDEEVLARLVRRDEAEALVVVEPLHRSGGHGDPPRVFVLRLAEDAGEASTAPPALLRRAGCPAVRARMYQPPRRLRTGESERVRALEPAHRRLDGMGARAALAPRAARAAHGLGQAGGGFGARPAAREHNSAEPRGLLNW